jgi:hypothetical protein
MLAVLCRLALEPRRAAQNGSADTGKPDYFSVRCGNRSNETHFSPQRAQRSRRRPGLSFWRSSGWARSDSHSFLGDPVRFCASRPLGGGMEIGQTKPISTTEAQRSRRKQGVSFWRSSGWARSDSYGLWEIRLDSVRAGRWEVVWKSVKRNPFPPQRSRRKQRFPFGERRAGRTRASRVCHPYGAWSPIGCIPRAYVRG